MLLLWKDKERHIVDLMRKGEPSAMDKFYQEYADYLTGVCARYISDEDTLKDVMQESLVKIFTQFHQFEYRGKGSLKAWISLPFPFQLHGLGVFYFPGIEETAFLQSFPFEFIAAEALQLELTAIGFAVDVLESHDHLGIA